MDGGEGFYGGNERSGKVLLEAAPNVDKVVILSSIESNMNYVPAIGTGGIELDRNFYQKPHPCADQLERNVPFFQNHVIKTIILRLPYLTNSRNDGNFPGVKLLPEYL